MTPTRITHSKTSENEGDDVPPERAVDRHCVIRSMTEPVDGEAWLKLEFDADSFIHKVVVYARFMTNWYNTESNCLLSVDHFKNCVEDDRNGADIDVSVYQGEVKQKSCGTLKLTNGLEQSEQIYTQLCNIEGDTVKLSKIDGFIRVYDMAVTSKCKNL